MESEQEGVCGDEEAGGRAEEDRGESEPVRCLQRATAVHAALRRLYQERV